MDLKNKTKHSRAARKRRAVIMRFRIYSLCYHCCASPLKEGQMCDVQRHDCIEWQEPRKISFRIRKVVSDSEGGFENREFRIVSCEVEGIVCRLSFRASKPKSQFTTRN